MENAGVRPNEKTSSVDDVKGIYSKVQKYFGIIPEVAYVQVQGEVRTPFWSCMHCELLSIQYSFASLYLINGLQL